MAKFCNYCGTQLSDDAAFCPNCGSSVASAAPETPKPAESAPAQEASPSYSSTSDSAVTTQTVGTNKNLIIGVAAAVAVVIVLFFIGSSIISGWGYKGPIKNYVKAINNEDGKKYMKAIPQFVSDYQEKDADDYEEMLEDIKDFFDVGKDPKISYDIVDKIEIIEEDLKDYEDEINETYKKQLDDDVEVSAGYEVLLKFKVKGSKRTKNSFSTITVLKIDGDWYILD